MILANKRRLCLIALAYVMGILINRRLGICSLFPAAAIGVIEILNVYAIFRSSAASGGAARRRAGALPGGFNPSSGSGPPRSVKALPRSLKAPFGSGSDPPRRKEAILAACIILGTVCISCLLCAHQSNLYDTHLTYLSSLSSSTRIYIEGTVYRKEKKESDCLYYLKKTRYGPANSSGASSFGDKSLCEGGKVLFYCEDETIPVGARISGTGKANVFRPASNEGNFDAKAYYRSLNITFSVYADGAGVISEAIFPWREAADRLRSAVADVFRNELSDHDAGILRTLVLGDRSALDDDIWELYRQSGAAHILAVSGLHISVLGDGVCRLLRRRLRAPRMPAIIVCLCLVCIYAYLSGFGIAARRAMIFFGMRAGARITGRTFDMATAMAVSGLIILIVNPMALFQSGFLLSFTSVAAILAAREFEALNRRIRMNNSQAQCCETKNNLAAQCRSRIFVSACIQVWMLPIILWYYYETPVYALFINLLILPLCGWLLASAMIGGITGLIGKLFDGCALPCGSALACGSAGGFGSVWIKHLVALSKWTMVPSHWILVFNEKIMSVFLNFPCSSLIVGRPSVWRMFIFYTGWICLNIAVYRRRARMEQNISANRVSAYRAGAAPRRCRICTIGAAAVLIGLICTSGREHFRIDFLDVGQGDAIAITDGEGGHIMIDGGSSSKSEVGDKRILPFLKYHGISSVDVWIVTHADEDHTSGLREMLKEGYAVRTLIFSDSMPRDEAWEELASAAEACGTKIVYASEGDEILSVKAVASADDKGLSLSVRAAAEREEQNDESAGGKSDNLEAGMSISGTVMKCLYPSSEDEGKERNTLSQVWELSHNNFKALFTGDISETEEEILIERGLLENVDLLKAAHHGSKYASSSDFLLVTQPEWTVISCGENNLYNHPAPEMLKRLEEAGSTALITWECGQITFAPE